MPPNPLADTWLRHALHSAKRHTNAPTFPKHLDPPRNKTLDTPLCTLCTYETCSIFVMILLWVNITPLGKPVVPLEKGRDTRSS